MRDIFKCYIHDTIKRSENIWALFFQSLSIFNEFHFLIKQKYDNFTVFVSKYFSFTIDDKIAESIKRTNTFAISMTWATFQLFGEIVDIVHRNVATDCVQKIAL